MARKSWVQDPVTHKLIPKEEFYGGQQRNAPEIMPDIEAFKSPIDGSVISSRSALRQHNKRHEVTNIQDYGPEWFKRKEAERQQAMQMQRPQDKKERIEALRHALDTYRGKK